MAIPFAQLLTDLGYLLGPVAIAVECTAQLLGGLPQCYQLVQELA